MKRALLVLLAALALGGCASIAPVAPQASGECAQWFARLDAAVDAAGVRDAQDERIDGFPGLRVDRFGAATRPGVGIGAVETPARFDHWLARASALDRDAREVETRNLPRAAWPIDGAADARAAQQRSNACRDAWPARLRADAAARAALLARATVPDRYSTPLRALGLYPIVRLPFFAGVNAWQRRHEQAVARWAASPPPRARFTAAGGRAPLVFEIERQRDGTLAAFDRFGAPFWQRDDTPAVDSAQPVVYRRESQALYRGRVLRQEVYTLWFPQRPRAGRLDLLGGALDGVIVRLTYGADGVPLLLDTIHACGCYHLFFPGPGIVLREGAPAHEEWAFVPARLPALRAGERIVVRLASATHYVTGVVRDEGDEGGDGATYTLRDEHALRALPLAGTGGATRSLYGPDGLVRGSERGERFLFWPMGIASAGAMRQWGHHATAFVGRRHFDDARLIEQRFLGAALDHAPP